MNLARPGEGPVHSLSGHILAGTGSPVPAIHYASHSSLLRRYRPGGEIQLDAIVVSAARAAGNLRPALRLGAAIDVPVVLMCSHAARAEDAAEIAAASGARFVVVDVSRKANLALPDFETSHFGQAQVGSHGDLSRKRNLGLLLGWLASWRTVLFLDDDICGLNPMQVARAVAALEYFAAVGMPARRFPDNSVVCHAHRLSGGKQGVFVSASALAVNLSRIYTFFPDIYNEDWLFLAPHVDRHQVASYGSVRQQRYSPFTYPHRAGAQEFGDVLGEGLLGYLHSTRLHRPPSVDYWTEFLARRADFITLTMRRLLDLEEPNAEVSNALTALKIAQSARSKISAEILSEYVDAWFRDLQTWRKFLDTLPRAGRLSEAFRFLDLWTIKAPTSSARHQ